MAKYVNSDGLQYAISKIKTLLNGKANTSHNHDITGLTNFNTAVYNATLSRTANTFLAAPNGSNGAGSFRKIVENDLPAEMANHTIPYYKSFGASSGTAGYLKIINIDMSSGTYMNQPLVFLLGQRSSGLCWLTVIFSQSSTAGSSSVSKFMKFGSDMNLYIVKTANDKFSIYAKKSEGYDSISLYGYYKGAYMANCKVTFVDEFASSVPTGYTTAGWGGRASYANSAGYTDNSLTIQLNGTTAGTFNGSAAKTINITPSGIGASASGHTHNYVPLAGGTMTGNLTIQSSGSKDIGIELKNTDSDAKAMAIIIGSGKTNRGLYDRSGNKWIVYADANNNAYLNGNATTATTATKVKVYKRNADSSKGKWLNLGTITIGTTADSATMTYYTGDGMNGGGSQNSIITIMLKKAWQSTASATSAVGVSATLLNAPNSDVKVVATNSTTYKIYVYNPWDYPNGTIELGGNYTSYTESTEVLSSAPTGTLQNVTLYKYGSAAWKNITYGTAAPSGTANTGDIYIQYS